MQFILFFFLKYQHIFYIGHRFEKEKVVSAGFVNVKEENGILDFYCERESVSLGIKSRKEIDDIIMRSSFNMT